MACIQKKEIGAAESKHFCTAEIEKSGKKSSHHHCECCAHDDEDEEEEEHSLKKIFVAIILFVLAMCVEKLPFFASLGLSLSVHKGLSLAFFCASYLISGLGVLRGAVKSVLRGRVFGEEFLMGIATIGAILLGEYSEAVAVMILFQIGEFFEDKAVDKSRKSISDLMDIRPDSATVKRGGEEICVRAEDVRVGEVIVVRAGERIALDGEVISGESELDSSALTGESRAVSVEAGSSVLSGCVNLSGALEIRVTKGYGESTAARILEMVEKAADKKASSERFVTRFARVYTPAVCAIAALTAIIPVLLFGADAKVWVYRALEILVVSCPCALVISVPLSFFAGIGLASRYGILVKGSSFIEKMSKARTVVFDKTGTLTKGTLSVTHVESAGKFDSDELLAVATHAEYYSNHPISRSLKSAHSCPDCALLSAKDSEEIRGKGIRCTVSGHKVLAGNERLMKDEGVVFSASVPSGASAVHIATDGEYAGLIALSDTPKDDAAEAVKALRKCGAEKIVMLTGDAESCARETADKLGIVDVRAELLPEDKVLEIEKLIAENRGAVIFVGDGINDAPVLTRSDAGIAMGALGSDAAIEAADVVIMDDKPSRVSDAIRISRGTMAVVWQNVAFSLSVKIAIIALCAAGLANMWFAVFGDVGVCMLAVLNAMRPLFLSKKKS